MENIPLLHVEIIDLSALIHSDVFPWKKDYSGCGLVSGNCNSKGGNCGCNYHTGNCGGTK